VGFVTAKCLTGTKEKFEEQATKDRTFCLPGMKYLQDKLTSEFLGGKKGYDLLLMNMESTFSTG